MLNLTNLKGDSWLSFNNVLYGILEKYAHLTLIIILYAWCMGSIQKLDKFGNELTY